MKIERPRQRQTFDRIMRDLLAIDEAWDRETMLAYLEHLKGARVKTPLNGGVG